MNTLSHRILIIDDDSELNELLTEYFARFGHRLRAAETAASGLQMLQSEPPDLLILDIMLPDMNGLNLCSEIRRTYNIPIIMLTARGEVSDRILGLELGADDYMPKPFEPRELVARIDTVLRRSQKQEPKVVSAAGLVLEPETRHVSLDGETLDLTTMEFELLNIFMNRPGKVLSRNRLIDDLSGIDAAVYDRSVDMLVSRLRQKLGDDSRTPRYIKTVWGSGYQFIG